LDEVAIRVEGKPLKDMDSFTYLGSVVDRLGGTDRDVAIRVGKARSVFLMLTNIWASKGLTTTKL